MFQVMIMCLDQRQASLALLPTTDLPQAPPSVPRDYSLIQPPTLPRVFSDRLVDVADMEAFVAIISDKLGSFFDLTFHNLCPNKRSPIFGEPGTATAGDTGGDRA